MELKEIGEVLGISYETVRKIEIAALRKLKVILAERGITLEDWDGT